MIPQAFPSHNPIQQLHQPHIGEFNDSGSKLLDELGSLAGGSLTSPETSPVKIQLGQQEGMVKYYKGLKFRLDCLSTQSTLNNVNSVIDSEVMALLQGIINDVHNKKIDYGVRQV